MSLSETRFGGNATGLPAVLPPLSTALSRRAALFGAVTVAGLGAATAVPARGHAAALCADDSDLLRLCADLHAVDAEEEALIQAHRGLDCEDMPGWSGMEERRYAALAAIAAMPAKTLAGVVSKCRVQQTEGVQGSYQDSDAIGTSIAADIARLHAAGAIS